MRQRQIGRLRRASRWSTRQTGSAAIGIEAGGLGIEGGEFGGIDLRQPGVELRQSDISSYPLRGLLGPAGASQSARLPGWSRACSWTRTVPKPSQLPPHVAGRVRRAFLVVRARAADRAEEAIPGRSPRSPACGPAVEIERCLRSNSPTLLPTLPAGTGDEGVEVAVPRHFTAVLGPHFSTPGRCPRYRRPRQVSTIARRRHLPNFWPRRCIRRALPRSWY